MNIARRLALLLMPLVGLATLLGGSVFWLRRVGWLQADKYYLTNTELILRSGHPYQSQATYEYVMNHHGSMHQLEGWLYLTKYPREGLLVAFVLLALTQIPKFRSSPGWLPAWLGLGLLAGISAAAALLSAHWFALLAGARSLGGWCIGAFATPLIDAGLRQGLARVCAWTLVAEFVMVMIEVPLGTFNYTILLFGTNLPRVVGSFNLPASLGTFAVVACAMAWCWSGYSRRALYALTAMLLLLLVVNASSSAWVTLGLIVAWLAYSRLRARWRPWLLVACLPIALLGWQALPALTGRADVHDSLWGRIAPVAHYAGENLSMTQVLFGTSFGLGTNGLGAHGETTRFLGGLPDRPVGDSTPAVLFWQFGLFGVLCAYALFALALRADGASRTIGIALLVSSAAINIAELFPVNLILGFWLANAAGAAKRDDDPA